MKNQEHKYNKEMPMENLFQEAFDSHTEPTSEKDFEQFMSQLEDTGFFKGEKNYRRPFFYFLIGLVVVGGLFSAYLFFNKSDSEKSTMQINSENKLPPSDLNNVSDEDSAIQSTIKSTDATGTEIKSNGKEVQKAAVTLPVAGPTSAVINNTPVATIVKDSSVNVTIIVPDKKKVAKDSIRVRYVIAVDTVKTVDSLNIKKRKYDKMKGKSK